eukprot:GHVU01020667.1.p3 GENE.GHVU01020667.1~~GHVU01020667.1.p3  ORF type:complete len:120 (+),score=13.95 GHVU01020667.1:330-689(+)
MTDFTAKGEVDLPTLVIALLVPASGCMSPPPPPRPRRAKADDTLARLATPTRVASTAFDLSTGTPLLLTTPLPSAALSARTGGERPFTTYVREPAWTSAWRQNAGRSRRPSGRVSDDEQ